MDSTSDDEPIEDAGTLVAFFMMPVDILKDLHNDFANLIGERLTSVILFQAGYRSGFGIIKRMDVKCKTFDEISDNLPNLWIELGLGLIEILQAEENNITVVSSESKEALAMGTTGKPACYLTSGYLAGVISSLMGAQYHCEEVECLSAGNSQCKYEVHIKEE